METGVIQSPDQVISRVAKESCKRSIWRRKLEMLFLHVGGNRHGDRA